MPRENYIIILVSSVFAWLYQLSVAFSAKIRPSDHYPQKGLLVERRWSDGMLALQKPA